MKGEEVRQGIHNPFPRNRKPFSVSNKETAMRKTFGTGRIELHQGDITQQEVDAIVNAANSALAGGGGVDGAIHRGGGATIKQETDQRYPEGCPTGSAVITGAGDLVSRYVIHAVGPVWRGGQSNEAELLRQAYHQALLLARDNHCRSIAFPALSTGAYRYPLDQAARVALSTTIAFLQNAENGPAEIVRFVLFDAAAYGAFAAALESFASGDE